MRNHFQIYAFLPLLLLTSVVSGVPHFSFASDVLAKNSIKSPEGPCPYCPVEMVPREISDFVSQGCLDTEGAISIECHNLEEQLSAVSAECSTRITNDTSKWDEFKQSFKDPCQLIPAEYLNPKNPHFLEMIEMISPKIVMHPDDENPPKSFQSILNDLSSYGSSAKLEEKRTVYEFSAEAEEALGSAETKHCSTPLSADGKCCGSIDVPLYFDYNDDAPTDQSQFVKRISFVTAHRYGSYLDISKSSATPGSHIFDSEGIQINYKTVEGGFVQADQINFSRHGTRLAYESVCSDSNGLKRRYHDGTHPVFFQAVGGHALYDSARNGDEHLGEMRSTSSPEKLFEEDSPRLTNIEKIGFVGSSTAGLDLIDSAQYEALQKAVQTFAGDKTIAAIENRFNSGGCVTTLKPSSLQALGALWNNPVYGANANGKLVKDIASKDVCIEYAEGKKRSLRYLAAWFDGSDRSLDLFNCQ